METLQQIVSVPSQISVATSAIALVILNSVAKSTIQTGSSLSNATAIAALTSLKSLSTVSSNGQQIIDSIQNIGSAATRFDTSVAISFSDPTQSISVIGSPRTAYFVTSQLRFADIQNTLPTYSRLVASTIKSNPFLEDSIDPYNA